MKRTCGRAGLWGNHRQPSRDKWGMAPANNPSGSSTWKPCLLISNLFWSKQGKLWACSSVSPPGIQVDLFSVRWWKAGDSLFKRPIHCAVILFSKLLINIFRSYLPSTQSCARVIFTVWCLFFFQQPSPCAPLRINGRNENEMWGVVLWVAPKQNAWMPVGSLHPLFVGCSKLKGCLG